MPQVHNEVTEILTKEEVARYLTALYEERQGSIWFCLYITAFYTGMRKSAI